MVTPQNYVLGDSGFPGPLRQGLSFSGIGKPNVRAAVVGLFVRCRPLHIARLVVAIRVNAVNRMERTRARPDILQECAKRFAPTWAYRYSAPAVVAVTVIAGIAAPALDVVPDFVLLHMANGVCLAACVILLNDTTAAFNSASTQSRAACNYSSAAVTAAKPKALAFFLVMLRGRGLFDNQQPPVTVADFVFDARGKGRGMIGMHNYLLRSFAKSQAVDAALGHSIDLPLNYTTSQNKCTGLPWPMEGRGMAELGVSISGIWREYAER